MDVVHIVESLWLLTDYCIFGILFLAKEGAGMIRDIKVTFRSGEEYIIEATGVGSAFEKAKKYSESLGEVLETSIATEEDLTNPSIINLSRPF